MKASFLRRVSSGRDAQQHFYALSQDGEASEHESIPAAKAVEKPRQSPRGVMGLPRPHKKQQPNKLPFRAPQQPKNMRLGLFQRLSRKKNSMSTSPKVVDEQETPMVKYERTERQIFTPVTLSETGSEVEVTLPVMGTSSCSITTQTMEISDFSGSASEQIQQRQASPMKRASSDMVTPSSRKMMVLNTSALSRTTSHSSKLARRTGNESVGDAKPNQPQRNILPPLLDADEESSCSGITMDFTYDDDIKMSPIRQSIGRWGEGVVPSPIKSPQSFVPPIYITMTESEDIDFDL
jgi:hypothetical protein